MARFDRTGVERAPIQPLLPNKPRGVACAEWVLFAAQDRLAPARSARTLWPHITVYNRSADGNESPRVAVILLKRALRDVVQNPVQGQIAAFDSRLNEREGHQIFQ